MFCACFNFELVKAIPWRYGAGIRLQAKYVQFTLNNMAKISKSVPSTGAARKEAVIYARVSSTEQEKEGFSILSPVRTYRTV